MFAPTRVSFILETSPTVREHPVGRGFEEVYKRSGQRPKSALHKRRTKTPLESIEKGSTLFALPSMGSYSFCWGSFGGARGDFFKSPLEQSRAPRANPRCRARKNRLVRRARSRTSRLFCKKINACVKKHHFFTVKSEKSRESVLTNPLVGGII